MPILFLCKIQNLTIFLFYKNYNIDIKFKKEGCPVKSKALKRTIAIAMSAATLLTSAVSLTAFAAETEPVQAASASEVTYVENHSVIDCTNRYKMYDGRFNFTVKIPKGSDLKSIPLKVTLNSEGTSWNKVTLAYYRSSLTYLYSDSTCDYYELILSKYSSSDGVGIKLYCEYNGGYYMATDNGNGQTIEGRGYWLSA